MSGKGTATRKVPKTTGLDFTLQDIIDGVEDELIVIDSDRRIRFVNSAVRDRFQKEEEQLIGQPCYKVLHDRKKPCSAPLWDCPLNDVLHSGSATTVIHPVSTSGSDTYLKVTAYPLRDSQGDTKAIVELRRNVTAERELETQILRRHHQLLALSHISSAVRGLQDLDTILKIALDNVLEIVNGAVGGIMLLDRRTDTLNYRIQRGLSVAHAEGMRLSLGEGIAGRVAQTGEPIMLDDISKDPRVFRHDLVSAEGVKAMVSIPLKAKDKVVGVMNVSSYVAGRFGADDVSLLNSIGDYLGTTIEQATLYERLARVGERNRVLLRHSLTAQEEERKRVAKELHDETCQALTSLTLSLQAALGLAEVKGIADEEFLERLRRTHEYAVHTGNEVVKLMKELRPTLLDELGLAAAIQRYAKDTIQTQGIDVRTEFIGTDRRFAPEVEVTLLRVAQGVMGNIMEHSEAKNAFIKLECDDKDCALYIEDDGKGFDSSKLTGVEPSGRGSGLFTMRERLSMVGGVGYVDSKPGHGTKITARVPLVRDVADEEDKSADS